MLGNHADAFFLGHNRERVTARSPNAQSRSYRVPDAERVLAGPSLPGMGGDDRLAGPSLPGMGAAYLAGPSLPGMGSLRGPSLPGMGSLRGPSLPGMGGLRGPYLAGPSLPGMGDATVTISSNVMIIGALALIGAAVFLIKSRG